MIRLILYFISYKASKKIKENKLVQLINNKSQETNKCPGFYYSSLEGMKSNDGEFGTI